MSRTLQTLLSCLSVAVCCTPALAQEVNYFDFVDKISSTQARVYLPGQPNEWHVDLHYKDSPETITRMPEILLKGVFASADGKIEGVIRTIDDLKSYDAPTVFDGLAREAEGLQRTAVSKLYETNEANAMLFEYYHPVFDRIVGVKLLSNSKAAIEIMVSVPNDPTFADEYKAIFNSLELQLGH